MFYLQFAQVLKTAFCANSYGITNFASTKNTAENLIDRNLAEDMDYTRVDHSVAWLEFLDKVALA